MEFAEFIKTPMVDGVTLYRPNTMPIEGTLCITGHHLILSSRRDQREELWLLHKRVDSLEKKYSGSSGTLTFKLKDFKVIHMEIPSPEDCMNIAQSVEQLSNIDNINLYYPFFFRPMFDIMENGWQAFLPETEYSRLKASSDEWRLSFINRNYEVCPTYPSVVVVPKNVDDETLARAAVFRQGGRFPVLSYFHKENGIVILRSSQPMTGVNNRRCKEDEKLVNAVLGIGKRGYIIDTRSPNAAKLAAQKGGGVEPEAHYPQWRRIHQAIERHHVLHESLIKLIEACNDTNTSMDKWLSKLESSNWLTHVKDVLNCACVAAQCIDKEGASVLVHGSEGLDSTLTVTALSQLLLDPDCRTVRGFEALIEREWLQAGHAFADRCSKSAYAVTKHHQEAPVFLLFLDCVWQIWQQYPLSFEFNEDFMILLFQHAYYSQFGTFLCNNDRERKHHDLSRKTVSLWSFLNRPEVLQNFLNPLYEPNPSTLWPSVAPQSLQLWSGMYQRWTKLSTIQQDLWEEILIIKENDKDLKAKAMKLRKHLATLEKEAIENGLIPTPAGQDGYRHH